MTYYKKILENAYVRWFLGFFTEMRPQFCGDKLVNDANLFKSTVWIVEFRIEFYEKYECDRREYFSD